MFLLLIFAFIAGIVTILSPCILPILPIVLSGSLAGGKRRPLGVIIGFILSFTFFATFSFALAKAIGLSTEILRQIAVIFLLIFGLSLFSSKIQLWIEQLISRIPLNTQQKKNGFIGGIILGITLGFIWTPCVGPILASVLTLAATSQITFDLILITFSYSTGTAIPLFLITYGGKKVLNTLPFFKKNSLKIQKAFAVLIILTALMIQFNYDRKFQIFILEKFPGYGEGIIKIEENDSVRKELDKLNQREKISLKESLFPDAPNQDFSGASKWVNSEPLTLQELRGKVVLVDFWTYTCINCIRTFPYIVNWYNKYKDDGFVLIGVHTPEFEFEKKEENVIKAMKEYGITYPVVQDNEYEIWKSYNNRYWPAHYLIDKNGKIRYTHFGEGNYDETERKIQELLEEAGSNPVKMLLNLPSNLPNYEKTPESYLGYGRIDRFSSLEEILRDKERIYTSPTLLDKHFFAYEGKWMIGQEYALSYKNSKIMMNFEAKEVYLVMKPMAKPGRVKVKIDGKVITEDIFGDDVKGGVVTVDTDRLYHLIEFGDLKNKLLEIEFIDNPIEVFAFTFG